GLGVALPGLLAGETQTAGRRDTKKDKDGAKDKDGISLIILFLKGGLSTIDTFDLKPHAPAEIRGEFSPIATNVTRSQIGEHLPRVARQMDKFSLVRSFAHKNSDHGPADHYMLTG